MKKEEVTETETKLGRKPISGEAMSPAARQRRARSFAMKNLCDSNVNEVSTSGLIALLPTLVRSRSSMLVDTVCKEIMRREGSKAVR